MASSNNTSTVNTLAIMQKSLKQNVKDIFKSIDYLWEKFIEEVQERVQEDEILDPTLMLELRRRGINLELFLLFL